MIAVVDYGMGNLHSVRNALDMIGAEVCVTKRPEDLRAAEADSAAAFETDAERGSRGATHGSQRLTHGLE